ncbi:AAA family ATPase [Secundilactobacillus paracollinoides]|uniref:ATPase AAA-type core domain-containing protein n=1 Tax=Secundilactobacillus paracollinoides TaxID=240427 RepID=A0A1B2IVE7_9LACO|nr:AAA family ATPase [Secundilactobacillus paracollinoides]ANZ60207.1 hypothetical protein AYR61_01800 [Secundilactobacillus paracollinoides]ANZ66001.1 hypothetical protein AYR63_01820 [Secundilactobacillus paracollinoides]
MEILQLKVNGLRLFDKTFEFNFMTEQNVTDLNSDSVQQIFNRIYKNNVIALAGKNASGKTMALNIIMFVYDVFVNNMPMNHSHYRDAIIGEVLVFELGFFEESEQKIYRVVSTIEKKSDGWLFFSDEVIDSKQCTAKTNKKNLFDFDAESNHTDRRPTESLLPDDNTYFRKITTHQLTHRRELYDFSGYNNMNLLSSPLISRDAKLQSGIMSYLDPSIDYVRSTLTDPQKDDSLLFEVKFKNSPDVHFANTIDIFKYVSAGTIKGMNLFNDVFLALNSGSYLVVDEIENHFHRAIVQTVISLFSDPSINKHGATLIFTTHYPQILDEFDRNDDIYISLRKTDKISLERFNSQITRDDAKKSDIYESDVLGGTAPSYQAYMQIRKFAKEITSKSSAIQEDSR